MEANNVIHLSYTGLYAGVRLCGISKADGPEACHAAYCPDALMNSGRICPECLKVWNSEDDEN